MPGKLDGLCILIAEDELLLAEILADLVRLNGGTVAGPVASEREAWAVLLDGPRPDAAVLDVRLRDRACFPLAEALLRRGIPVVLTTGQPLSAIPERLRHLPVFAKPSRFEDLVACLADCCACAVDSVA